MNSSSLLTEYNSANRKQARLLGLTERRTHGVDGMKITCMDDDQGEKEGQGEEEGESRGGLNFAECESDTIDMECGIQT